MTDGEQAQSEFDEIYRMVGSALGDPGSLRPEIPETGRRAHLRLWERPSFTNHRCWAVWGPASAPLDQRTSGLLRRVVWRRDLDTGRSDALRRLASLGQAVKATLEVTDRALDVQILTRALQPPVLASPGEVMRRPRAIHLDGDWYGVELDSGSSSFRCEWFGVAGDWAPVDTTYQEIASWSIALRDDLDALASD